MRLVEREWETIEAVEAPSAPVLLFPSLFPTTWEICGPGRSLVRPAGARMLLMLLLLLPALRFIISLVRPAWDPIPGLKAAPFWFHPPPIQKA